MKQHTFFIKTLNFINFELLLSYLVKNILSGCNFEADGAK